MKNKILLGLVLLVAIAAVFGVIRTMNDKPAEDESVTPTVQLPQLNTTSIASFDYDATAYTQGLEFYKGNLIVSAGGNGRSFLASYKPGAYNKPINPVKMDASIFAEGCTVLKDTLYQLTYQNKKMIKYNPTTFQKIGEVAWPFGNEGWGLANDGTNLIATNSTSNLYFFNPTTMAQTKVVNVTANGTSIAGINELEYANGYIYANQYTTDYIYKIDPNNGKVLAVGDFKNLLPDYNANAPRNNAAEYVLNGIAYNPQTQSFFITGKQWPKIFEVKF